MRHYKIVTRVQANRPLDPDVPVQWEYVERCSCGANFGWPCPLTDDEGDAESE